MFSRLKCVKYCFVSLLDPDDIHIKKVQLSFHCFKNPDILIGKALILSCLIYYFDFSLISLRFLIFRTIFKVLQSQSGKYALLYKSYLQLCGQILG